MNLIIPNEGEVKVAENVLRIAFSSDYRDESLIYSFNNLSLTINYDKKHKNIKWVCQLIVHQNISDRGFFFPLTKINYGNNKNLKFIEIIAFVDRVFPSFISKFKFVQEG